MKPLQNILKMAQLVPAAGLEYTNGAHAMNSSASVLEVSKDGLENKDRWHWKERDLREWINQWLMSAFVQFDNGSLFEDVDMSARVVTIRGDYEEGEGEAFLNWRKGKCFATYHFGMRLEFQGTVRVNGRIIGQSKGVLRMNDIKYDDTDEDNMTRKTSLLQGAWEVPVPGQQHEAGNKGQPMRKPQPYEEAVKELFQTDRGLGPIRTKLAILRKCLQEIADSEEVANGSLPDATINARKAMRVLKGDENKDKVEESGLSKEAIQAAEDSAKVYVENLRVSGRSDRFVKALEDPSLTTVTYYSCPPPLTFPSGFISICVQLVTVKYKFM